MLNRRNFLKSSAAIAAPLVLPSTVFGANERVGLAYVGVRSRGAQNFGGFKGTNRTVPVAFCDVDDANYEKIEKAARNGGFESVPRFADYRDVLDRSDVDAVVVSTPDHWHAIPTIEACKAGKDVYCEKPLTLRIAEGRAMVNAAREHGRVVQTGSQQRSGKEFLRACTIVRSGAIGDVSKVLVGIAKCNHPGAVGKPTPPPSSLDYNRWLGPAPEVPYIAKRVHYNFRFWWDYSGGQMTNWGAHHLDIARWGLGVDETGPVSIDGVATFHPEKVHEVTETCRITQRYASGPVSPDGVEVTVGQKEDDIPMGTTFIGSEGTVFVTRGKIKVTPKELEKKDLDSFSVTLKAAPKGHYHNFLDCVASREKPTADVEIGHRSATACHLNNLVARLGRGVGFDPVKEQIVGDAEAAALAAVNYRAPYSLG